MTEGLDSYRTVADALSGFPEASCNQLLNHEVTSHRGGTVERLASLEYGESPYGTQVRRRLPPDQPAWTISGKKDAFVHPEYPRILTSREYARLQSFPDDWVFCGDALHTEFRQLKNAVPPRLARHMAEVMR